MGSDWLTNIGVSLIRQYLRARLWQILCKQFPML